MALILQWIERQSIQIFIEFEKQLFSNPDEKLLEFLKVTNLCIEKYRDKFVFEIYQLRIKGTLGDSWSNLETMISQLADAIMYFKENNDLLFKVATTGQNWATGREIITRKKL